MDKAVSLLAGAGLPGVPQAYWPVGIGAALALLFLCLSLRAGSRRRLIDNIPTSKTTGVFIGLVELSGTAESPQPLTSYLAGIPCVSYGWSVEEHWSRTVTETYRDAKGHTQTRTRHESGWTTVAGGGQSQPFYLKDDCGLILVWPEGAKVEDAAVFDQTCGRGDAMYYMKGPMGAVSHSDHRRRFTEHAIVLHGALYVMGHARERQDVVAPEIAADAEAPVFLISTRSEKQISRGLAIQFWVWGVLGAVAAAAGGIVCAKMGESLRHGGGMAMGPGQDVSLYIATAGGFLGLWLLGWLWMAFNSMVRLREMVTQAWSNVDVQLHRRADLIPNLVEAVKGFGGHERTLQESLALLRSQAQATRPGSPGPDPVATNTAILAIVEHYPQLKANDVFMRLQRQLADTENRIALAREYFNNIAEHYNRRLAIVPESFVAWLGRFREQPFFAAAGFERQAVAVKLAE
jgi:hypothetical protein